MPPHNLSASLFCFGLDENIVKKLPKLYVNKLFVVTLHSKSVFKE